jgi:hypothetical protein
VLIGHDVFESSLTITSFGKDGPELSKPKSKRAARRKSAAKK